MLKSIKTIHNSFMPILLALFIASSGIFLSCKKIILGNEKSILLEGKQFSSNPATKKLTQEFFYRKALDHFRKGKGHAMIFLKMLHENKAQEIIAYCVSRLIKDQGKPNIPF